MLCKSVAISEEDRHGEASCIVAMMGSIEATSLTDSEISRYADTAVSGVLNQAVQTERPGSSCSTTSCSSLNDIKADIHKACKSADQTVLNVSQGTSDFLSYDSSHPTVHQQGQQSPHLPAPTIESSLPDVQFVGVHGIGELWKVVLGSVRSPSRIVVLIHLKPKTHLLVEAAEESCLPNTGESGDQVPESFSYQPRMPSSSRRRTTSGLAPTQNSGDYIYTSNSSSQRPRSMTDSDSHLSKIPRSFT